MLRFKIPWGGQIWPDLVSDSYRPTFDLYNLIRILYMVIKDRVYWPVMKWARLRLTHISQVTQNPWIPPLSFSFFFFFIFLFLFSRLNKESDEWVIKCLFFFLRSWNYLLFWKTLILRFQYATNPSKKIPHLLFPLNLLLPPPISQFSSLIHPFLTQSLSIKA